MNAVYIHLPTVLSIEDVADRLGPATVDGESLEVGPTVVCLNGPASRVYALFADRAFFFDYEPPGAVTVELDYSSIEQVQRAAVALARLPGAIVDNDHGFLGPGAEFVERVGTPGTWDWWPSLEERRRRRR